MKSGGRVRFGIPEDWGACESEACALASPPRLASPTRGRLEASSTIATRLRSTSGGRRLFILDNYAAHKHPKVMAWLDRHPRFAFHFTPTSCSWLNPVEGFFAKLTKRRLKRGVFRSIVDLQEAINRFLPGVALL